jgi:hypothetical protein
MWQYGILDGLETNNDVSSTCPNDVNRLWRSCTLELELGYALDALDEWQLHFGEERHADSASTGSPCSACPMYVGLYILRRLKLHDQVNFRDIEPASCHIRRYQTLKLPLFEALERHLSLLLWDVAMKDLRLLLQVRLSVDLVGFLLCLAEDDGSAVASTV